jgi:thiosulfate/3-mercaptopyruvate sulfurtransferase
MAEVAPLVSTQWLADHLGDPSLRILDASYFVPGGIPPALAQYQAGHIPGAVFFDINAIADRSKAKEHAFPNAAMFAAGVGALGIGNNHHVIAYDHVGGGIAAARVWFMFRAFGHANVSILNGGRAKWTAEGRPLTKDVPHLPPQVFHAETAFAAARDKSDMLGNIGFKKFQVLDARAKGRFEGTEPEVRPGLRSGHIPGSRNLPFLQLLDPKTQTWKTKEELAAAFADAGIDLAKPLVTTCGSGVSACALALGAYLVGKTDTAIYDGSWVEWGADATLPLETGAAR